MEKIKLIWEKLKREWKTFALQVGLFLAASWELASQMGADLPSMFSFLPDEYKAWALFGFAAVTLAVRKYTPTTIVVQGTEVPYQAPEEPNPSETPAVKEDK